jgi:hypothetical protein
MLWPSSARAAKQQEMGAALALPIITGTDPAGGATVTASTVTNLGREGITLAIQVIDGDPGESWNSSSFSCYVTAHESTVFVFEPDGPGRSKVSFECSSSDANWSSRAALLNIPQTEHLIAATGIMFVAIEQNEVTVSKNLLIGDSVVIDYGQGAAYTLPGFTFQGLDYFSQDGDRQYRFDDLEYAAFPSVLASNFIAPQANHVTADLILFTLDGAVGQSTVPVNLKVDFYNDDERRRDTSIGFDCFTILPLEAIDPRFSAQNLGSTVGSLVLTPRDVSVGFSPHEHTGTGIDGVRNVPVLGWLVQTIVPGGSVEGTPQPGSRGSWARTLSQGMLSHSPQAGDVVNLETY